MLPTKGIQNSLSIWFLELLSLLSKHVAVAYFIFFWKKPLLFVKGAVGEQRERGRGGTEHSAVAVTE